MYSIQVEGLSKFYPLGVFADQKVASRKFIGVPLPFKRLWPILNGGLNNQEGGFWALKDINLNVQPGEIIGIVGKNGCGKSTLLKILSNVTLPTVGKATLRGQVGSLLEVGTGFHGELTGRQNIYLNGSILGMAREQIDRRLDEIVAFAEIDKFLDTPVKHYSSGMYMRLAFSVAAHLDCDIMLVDEVLAVGDIHFQKKCLGRIDSQVKSGKTVLFVSHNTSMVLQACSRCILLEGGQITADGTPQSIIEKYLSLEGERFHERVWNYKDSPKNEQNEFRLVSIKSTNNDGTATSRFDVKESFAITCEWEVLVPRHKLNVHLYFRHQSGVTAFLTMNNINSTSYDTVRGKGMYSATCRIPANFLNEGTFNVDYLVCTNPTGSEYALFEDALNLLITDDMQNSGVRGEWFREWPNSIMRPALDWSEE